MPKPVPDKRWPGCGATWSIGAIITIGFMLRVWTLPESLWIDELHTAWTVSGSWEEVATRARLGNNHPLFYHFVYGLVQVAGVREWTLRLLSLACGTGLIPLAYACTRRWGFARSTSLLAAALIAVDPHCLYFSREARPYAALQLVALASFAMLLQRLRTPRCRWRIGWIGLATLAFYLHYTAALFVAGQIVAAFALRLAPPEKTAPPARPARAIDFALDLLVIAVACSWPTMTHIWQVAARRDNWQSFVPRSPLVELFTIYPLVWYWTLPLVLLASSHLWARGRGKAAALSPVPTRESGSPAAEGSLPNRVTRPEDRFMERLAAALLTWFFATLVMAWALTASDVARLFFRRYVIGVGVVPALFAAWAWQQATAPSRLPAPLRRGLAVIMGGIVILGIGPFANPFYGWPIARHNHEDWRAAVAWINDAPGPRREWPVWIRSGLIEADAWSESPDPVRRDYCLLPVISIYTLNRGHPLVPLANQDQPRVSEATRTAARQRGGVWLLLRGRPAVLDVVVESLRTELATARQRSTVLEDHSWGNVRALAVQLDDVGGP